ncbi:MAG: hypothetical protein ACI4P4_15480 [Faecousia sp.]
MSKRKNKLRPCLVDGARARFHCWGQEDRLLVSIDCFLPPEKEKSLQQEIEALVRQYGYLPKGCKAEVVRTTYALVEYEDGSVGKEAPDRIRFLDRGEG